MASQSIYQQHPCPYSSSHASTRPTDLAQIYGATREMGPPSSLDFPPQRPSPMEIDLNSNCLNSSRTLPSPQVSASAVWESGFLQNTAFGDIQYGSSNANKMQQMPAEGQLRGTQQNPLVQWYTGNDGPWIPKDILEVGLEERSQSRHTGNRNPMSYGSQYRPSHQSDVGPYFGAPPPSDSGYGTRRSVGNTSVFSADVNERDQDCQSLIGHVAEYQGSTDVLLARDGRTSETWSAPVPISSTAYPNPLFCPTCQRQVKNKSELKKHDLRHRKPFVCKVEGCPRTEGFSTTNDLERHTKSKHSSAIPNSSSTKKYRCLVPGCKSREKAWPRLDNFRSHLKRVHQHDLLHDYAFDEMIRRGEFLERSDFDINREFSPQRFSSQDDSRPARIDISESLAKKGPLNWRTLHPEVVSPTQNPTAPIDSRLDKLTHQVPAQEGREPVLEIAHQNIVKPLEVFRPHDSMHESRLPLDSTILAPAGHFELAIEKAQHTSTQPTSTPYPQGKTTKQNTVSASDATITEVIKNALAGTHFPDTSSICTPPHGLERNELPNGKLSHRGSWSAVPNPVMPTQKGIHGFISRPESPISEDGLTASQAERKAVEVLQTLRNMGYTVKKDPSNSPKVQNTGSVAGNKSEHQTTCKLCKKFKGRPCEMKKHLKRHSRPYGCTFMTCDKVFGSKNDWKRHENSQHFHQESWRCDEEKPEGGACTKVCYRRQIFQEHLNTQHHISETDVVQKKVDGCRIGRNCQARFWCGFCVKLVDLNKKGLEAWTERFDHIDDHFMGRRGYPEKSIRDWFPVDSDKPRGDIVKAQSIDLSPDEENQDNGSDYLSSGSSDGSSPEAVVAPVESPADTTILDGNRPKRGRDDSSHEDCNRPTKLAKRMETYIYCCQCHGPHNPRFNQRCTTCQDAHQFCSNCNTEVHYSLVEES